MTNKTDGIKEIDKQVKLIKNGPGLTPSQMSSIKVMLEEYQRVLLEGAKPYMSNNLKWRLIRLDELINSLEEELLAE